MNVIFRNHQNKCIVALMEWMPPLGQPNYAVAEVTVAGGKSLILGGCAIQNPFGRTLIIAHTKELVKQNVEACEAVGIKPGICSASIRKDVFKRVTVGTVQTIVRRLKHFKDVSLILVDEVHRTPVNKTSSYRKIFEAIPHAKVRGLTGTAFRADGTGSLEKTFGPIIFKYSFLDALEDGYVKPLVPAHSDEAANISVEGLKTTKVDGQDEFDLTEMGTRAEKLSPLHAKAIKQTMDRQGRKCVLVFACNIKHANRLEKELRAAGVNAMAVHSELHHGTRDKAVAAFRSSQLECLISVAMFDTGFNVPQIDLEAFCRATKSPVFFAQALGRGARITPHAENCAVLDFGGNCNRHGSLDCIAAAPGIELECEECGTLWETWKHGRTCPECEAVHKSATKCKGCEARFDAFYHGATCPHCGLIQSAVKKCNACSQNYATFLHPICPHCGYDNTSVRDVGKDLSEGGHAKEIVSITDILKRQPWQDITRPPFRGTTSWQIPTKYATVRWPYDILPPEITKVFLVKTGGGHVTVKGWYGSDGIIRQL